MPILSLEASTSSAKAMLYDRVQGVLGVESIPYPAEVFDVVTFSPDGVADTVLRCGAALLARFPEVAVEGIGLSSIWHSLILLDGNREPLGRGYTWADTSPRADGSALPSGYRAGKPHLSHDRLPHPQQLQCVEMDAPKAHG